MRVVYWLLLSLLAASFVQADPASLDDLLKTVQQQQNQEKQLYQQRQARFLAQRNQQKQLLEQAQARFMAMQKKNNPLQKQKDENAAQIEQLEKQLQNDVNDMGDIYSIYTEFSGDFATQMRHSLVSSQLTQRKASLDKLSDKQQMPSMDDMYQLLFLLQQEITEAGKVRHYSAQVTKTDGQKQQQTIERLGAFSLMSQGRLLQYLPETGALLERQKTASGEPLKQGLSLVTIDPSRGPLLAVLNQSPDLKERIAQGGNVGYAIIIMGAAGLLLALYRLLYLSWLYRGVKRQQKQLDKPQKDNALGRILLQAQHYQENDEQSLQAHLNEAILKELPRLEAGQSLIKLLAAIAPLMGLLGTVVGMIVTFQSISLFGSGDPRLMAGGISQALVTTVEGLLVAIPLLFCHNWLSSFSRSLIQILDEQSAGLLAKALDSGKAA